MEFNTFDNSPQPEEIVLTYRQSEQIPPVELRCERPLPERMRRELEALFPESKSDTSPAESRKSPKKKKLRLGVKLVMGLSLLAALIGLGVGLWFLQQGAANDQQPPATEDHANDREPSNDDPFYYSSDEDHTIEETAIPVYRPSGGSMIQLGLRSAGDGAALAPGEIYEKLSPSTVTVLGENAQKAGYGVGTGIIFSEDGYILTNYHVIAGCTDCYVWITDQYGVDQEYAAMLVGGDADQDLAVLKIEARNLPVAEFGISDELSVGDPVYAIGNPLGLDLRSTFTDGIVSAVNRDIDVDGVTMTLIQTNAELNSGNSGGPLINQYGQVVGINTIKMMSGYDTIEGLGFAIPTSLAVRWVNELIETGEIAPQPVLGLSINRIPVTLPDGTVALEVAAVTPGLGADKAGIRIGDCIVSFNGQAVHRTEEVLAIRRTLHVGDQVPTLIWRNGLYMEVIMEMMEDTSTGK